MRDEVKHLSGTSSTTGADGDDDLSSTNSPAFGATDSFTNHGEVSDMLEAPAPGPSVLRLTESTQPQRVAKPRQDKAVQEQESKKQRQRKAKNEARKEELRQAEQERRVLLEKQLRTAREAEGRPAKNGVPVSKPPARNAWSASGDAGSGQSSLQAPSLAAGSNTPLLDTFDDTPKQVAEAETGQKAEAKELSHTADTSLYSFSSPRNDDLDDVSTLDSVKTQKPGANGTSHVNPNTWDRNLPSEEEQMRRLSELQSDGGWKEVKKREKPSGIAEKDVQCERRYDDTGAHWQQCS